MALDISVTILTKNSERYLYDCLHGLREFDDIVILDNGSTDRSLEIAAQFANVTVFRSDFIGFGPLKNRAAGYARHDWVLNIDSDEVLSGELLDEIRSLTREANTLYAIPRQNFYRNKLIKCCGWHPDRVLRLYHKQTTQFSETLVHESLDQAGGKRVVRLKHALNHHPFDSASELLQKMQRYSELYARENRGRKKSGPFRALFHALFSFFQNYILQRGFLYGYEGFIISVSNANGVFYKYIMLYEESKK